MKRSFIVISIIGLLTLCIYSCNNQDSSSAQSTDQTAEVKSADTASSVSKTDTLTIQPETPKVMEVGKKKVDTSSAKRNAKPSGKKDVGTESKAIDPLDIEEGKELIAKSDCLVCHKLQGKMVGPSYSDMAAKYSYTKTNVQNLAGKIVSGGAGVWGQVPMTPHPNVTSENAQKMVTYILSLKNN